MAGALGTYLSAQAAGPEAGRPVELVTGLVVAWSVGDRRVNVMGNDVPDLAYDANGAAGISPGDTVALLKSGTFHLVLCKVATA